MILKYIIMYRFHPHHIQFRIPYSSKVFELLYLSGFITCTRSVRCFVAILQGVRHCCCYSIYKFISLVVIRHHRNITSQEADDLDYADGMPKPKGRGPQVLKVFSGVYI